MHETPRDAKGSQSSHKTKESKEIKKVSKEARRYEHVVIKEKLRKHAQEGKELEELHKVPPHFKSYTIE